MEIFSASSNCPELAARQPIRFPRIHSPRGNFPRGVPYAPHTLLERSGKLPSSTAPVQLQRTAGRARSRPVERVLHPATSPSKLGGARCRSLLL
jgi:hypothetical protein